MSEKNSPIINLKATNSGYWLGWGVILAAIIIVLGCVGSAISQFDTTKMALAFFVPVALYLLAEFMIGIYCSTTAKSEKEPELGKHYFRSGFRLGSLMVFVLWIGFCLLLK